MIIQNKKSGRRMTCTREEYERLRNVGFAGNWVVITWDEERIVQPKKLPQEIIDFSQVSKKKRKKE